MSERIAPWRSYPELVADTENMKPIVPVCKYHVKFLDQALGGIFPSDVVLVGARTGAGKTEFVSTIAQNIAASGRRVNMIALEAEKAEIENRILFRVYAQKLFEKHENREGIRERINYLNFRLGKITNPTALKEAIDETSAIYKNLFITYKASSSDFSFDDMKVQLLSAASGMGAVILDHIHYVDIQGPNENQEMKQIIKEIRSVSLLTETPIIVVAHLRKPGLKNDTIVPDLEDFHGSSDLSKICTQAILLAPRYDEINDPTIFPTYIRIAKNRRDGSSSRYTAVANFDIRTNAYVGEYVLGQLNHRATEWTAITEQSALPWWAK